jgi:hypothetical protein
MAQLCAMVPGSILAGFTPACSAQPVVPAGPGAPPAPAPPPRPTPQQLGAQAVAHLPLPAPTLRVQPGEAIVGLLAYLEIGGPRTAAFNVTILGVPVTVSATSTYEVDWGDGSPHTAGLTTQGGPYPDGTIIHAYQSSGHFTITVTQHWTATWAAEGAAGTIGGLFTAGRLTLPVFEVQANRD